MGRPTLFKCLRSKFDNKLKGMELGFQFQGRNWSWNYMELSRPRTGHGRILSSVVHDSSVTTLLCCELVTKQTILSPIPASWCNMLHNMFEQNIFRYPSSVPRLYASWNHTSIMLLWSCEYVTNQYFKPFMYFWANNTSNLLLSFILWA